MLLVVREAYVIKTVMNSIVKTIIFYCYFLRRAHGTEQAPFTWLFPPGTHFTAVLTDEMRINCLAQLLNILMQPRFDPLISVSTDGHHVCMTNMLHNEEVVVMVWSEH